MKSYLAIMISLVIITSIYCHTRKSNKKLRSNAEAETAHQIQKITKMVNGIKSQLINNIPITNQTNTNLNNSAIVLTNSTNSMTSSNSTTLPNTSTNSNSKINNSNCSKCVKKITSAHLTALNNIVQNANSLKTGNPMLYDNQMKKEAFKKQKLTKYFVEKLLEKFQIGAVAIAKCLKAPLSTFAKILTLSHEIVNGKKGFGQLSVLSTWLCDELKVIPEKLNDSIIFNDVKKYMNSHIIIK